MHNDAAGRIAQVRNYAAASDNSCAVAMVAHRALCDLSGLKKQILQVSHVCLICPGGVAQPKPIRAAGTYTVGTRGAARYTKRQDNATVDGNSLNANAVKARFDAGRYEIIDAAAFRFRCLSADRLQ